MTAPTRSRAETITLLADRLAQQEHEAACAAWDLRDRALDRKVLLTWARQWPDLHAEMVAAGLTADQADTVLYDAARLYVHPAARPSLVFLLAALREAVDRLADLTGGQLDPRDVHDGPAPARPLPWALSRWEIAEALLRADIDEALVPLLTGRAA
jgi:hypothetical protein